MEVDLLCRLFDNLEFATTSQEQSLISLIEIDFLCNTFKDLNLEDGDYNKIQARESAVLDGFAPCQASITGKVSSVMSTSFNSSLEIINQARFIVFGKFHSIIPMRSVYMDGEGVSDDLNFNLSDKIDGTLQPRYCPSWSHHTSLSIYQVLSVEEDNFGWFTHVNFIVVLSSAQRQILLDYYLFFLWQCSLIALVFLWLAHEKNYLIAFVISWMFSFYENDSSVFITLRQVQLDHYLFVPDAMERFCQYLGIICLKTSYTVFSYEVDNLCQMVGKFLCSNLKQSRPDSYLIDPGEECLNTQISLTAYLGVTKFSLALQCAYLYETIQRERGLHLTRLFSQESCNPTDLYKVDKSNVLSDILCSSVAWSLKSGSTCAIASSDYLYCADKMVVLFRQIRLDLYLFYREWKCLSSQALRKNDEISRIIASRQVKLDFYLFADDWVGLNLMTILEYGTSYMIKLEDGVVVLEYLMKWFNIGFCTWISERLFFPSRWCSQDLLPILFLLDQSVILNTWDGLWNFILHSYWVYLDIRPLSHWSPSERAWAVSTYINYRCRLFSDGGYKGIAFIWEEYEVLGLYLRYLFFGYCNVMVLSSNSLGADSVTDAYVLSCISSDLQHLYYHSSAEKCDIFPLSQNSAEGLGPVCCESMFLLVAMFCFLQVVRAFTYLDRIIAKFELSSYSWFVVLATSSVVDEAFSVFDDFLSHSVVVWNISIYLYYLFLSFYFHMFLLSLVSLSVPALFSCLAIPSGRDGCLPF